MGNDLLAFLYNWQSLIVGLLAVLASVTVMLPTWYMWETSSLMQAMDRHDVNLTSRNANFPASFFASRLSHLHPWIAKKVFGQAVLRNQGLVVWDDYAKQFLDKHSELRKARTHLKKIKWIG